MKRLRNNKGFTLIEVLLVTILLAVIAGLTIPKFSPTLARLELSNSANQLAYVMRYAQSRAVSKGLPVHLEFLDDFSQYWLAEQGDEEESDTVGFERIPGRWGRVYHFAKGLQVEFLSDSDEDYMIFSPDGQVSKAAIEVCASKMCKVVSTKEQRGYIRVYDEDNQQ